ncbi:MAG: Nif3-like dinuclear metal center hexameric protein [Oscillospiraceae bacterium]|jgi:dinuclear metal center YbgI/SA1388 family protein|nr:Nif3-like dinuclear metal center hexameric protein [Oscillospiraceae bacterium]
MPVVRDIFAWLDAFAPLATQMDFDNSGLLTGDASAPVTRVLLALDVTAAVVEAAARQGAELIVAHHPVIFHARKQLLAGDPAYALARRGVACIAWHTPLDAAPGGVNDVLAATLGLQGVALLPAAGCPVPCARIGTVEPQSAAELARRVAALLGAAVRYCDAGRTITRVAVCGGAGAFLLPELHTAQVDAYITGDADHHDFLDARQAGVSLLAAGHYETEIPVIPALAERLRAAFPALVITVAEEQSPCPTQTTPAP